MEQYRASRLQDESGRVSRWSEKIGTGIRRFANRCARHPASFLLPAILLALLWANGVRAGDANRAGLVVRFGDGSVRQFCISFNESSLNGTDLLTRSGLDVVIQGDSAYGAAICKVGGQGCGYPAEDCFCQCTNPKNCQYWSYWLLQGGGWKYSSVGGSGTTVHNGDVQGWSWAQSSSPAVAPGSSQLPNTGFDQICPAAVPPTNTPLRPTATLLPVATPVVSLSLQPNTVAAGGCGVASWQVSGAQAVYWDGQGVTGSESRQVCSTITRTYTLRVTYPGGELSRQVTLNVLAPTATTLPGEPTSTPAPTAPTRSQVSTQPTATRNRVPTLRPPDTPVPTVILPPSATLPSMETATTALSETTTIAIPAQVTEAATATQTTGTSIPQAVAVVNVPAATSAVAGSQPTTPAPSSSGQYLGFVALSGVLVAAGAFVLYRRRRLDGPDE